MGKTVGTIEVNAKDMTRVLNRLSEYESTGFEPEELKRVISCVDEAFLEKCKEVNELRQRNKILEMALEKNLEEQRRSTPTLDKVFGTFIINF